MGAFSFILYNQKNPNISIDYTNAFNEMKNRGDTTTHLTKTSFGINNYNEEKLKMELSRDEIINYKQYTFMMSVNKLSINDFSHNSLQPFEDPILHKIKAYPDLRVRPKRMLICNGEIYNYHDLKESNNFRESDLQSNSDVEIILPMYIKYGLEKTIDTINGDYSFILTENLETYDIKTTNVFVVRDQIGTRPLYRIKYNNKNNDDILYMFVSELKGIPKFVLSDSKFQIDEIPPGTYWSFNNTIVNKKENEFIRYHDWNIYKTLESCNIISTDPDTIANIYDNINKLLTKSVCDRYKCETKVGILLSGGFDSSIITSIIAKNFNTQITVITIGESIYATELVEHLEKMYNIDIIHHIININEDDFKKFIINSLNDIIYTLETYDEYTIKQSIPYAFLYDYIKKYTDIKVLLTGEGLDELCGYNQFKDLDDHTFQNKSVKLIKNLSKFDLLRSDKMAGRYNLEVRHPFLDVSFIKYILNIHPKLKKCQVYSNTQPPIEKYIIRKAFDNGEYLPYNILWKTIKDASDCFEKTTINNVLEEYTNENIKEYDLNEIFNTKEKMYFKNTFDKIFGKINGLGTINDTKNNILNKTWNQLWE